MGSDKNTLIYTWLDGLKYRLVGRAEWTKGHVDEFLIEVQDTDSLGGERWTTIAKFAADDQQSQSILARALRMVVAELDQLRRQTLMGTGHA